MRRHDGALHPRRYQQIREVMSPLDRLTPLMPQKSEPKDEPPT